jgi:hypothetical protein
MGLVKKLGQDLSTSHGAVTGQSESHSDRDSLTITLEGPYSAFPGNIPKQGDTSAQFGYIPANCYVESSKLASDGKGGGTLTVNCIFPGSDSQEYPAQPTTVTYRIEMAEEQTDLVAHPALASVVGICLAWQATNDKDKIDSNGDYQYDSGDGNFTPVTDPAAIKFCQAWLHGIKTYNRYFPVVDKISEYKRVPGLSLTGASITSGTAAFSANIGTWNAPGITLAGYFSPGSFYKSKDSWVQNANKSWTRTEQWVWTPDGQSSPYGWIYNSSSSSSSNGGGGAS